MCTLYYFMQTDQTNKFDINLKKNEKKNIIAMEINFFWAKFLTQYFQPQKRTK